MAIPAHLYAEMKRKHAANARAKKTAARAKAARAKRAKKLTTQLKAAHRAWHAAERKVATAVRTIQSLQSKIAALKAA